MNDGVCDPLGRFWATCMAWDATPGGGSVFRVDHDGTITTVVDRLTIPNGPAFTADGSTMYLADSARGLIFRHNVDHAGQLGPAREFVRIGDGQPDGMTVDDAGCLWVAVWGAGEVRRYGPDGSLQHAVTVPAQQPTALCLGGPDGRRLFVTTAAYGLTGDQVGLSGGVFALDVETPGTPAAEFSYTRRSTSRTEP
jgi:sugar lactone lactonase YvrE